MSLRTYSHQLAALDAKAVKAWLQDASWKGRANKTNPRFYADVPADDSGPFAAIRKAIIDAINKAERKKRQKGKKAESTVPPKRFSLKDVKVEPTGLKATTKTNIGNTYALGVKHSAATKAKLSAANKGKPKTAATKAKMSAAHKAKMSAANKGKPKTAAHKAKMSAARKGKPKTAAHKPKIAKSMMGNTNKMKKAT